MGPVRDEVECSWLLCQLHCRPGLYMSSPYATGTHVQLIQPNITIRWAPQVAGALWDKRAGTKWNASDALLGTPTGPAQMTAMGGF
eukprot:1156402-Pelagomonas_calceolata.AAC.5